MEWVLCMDGSSVAERLFAHLRALRFTGSFARQAAALAEILLHAGRIVR